MTGTGIHGDGVRVAAIGAVVLLASVVPVLALKDADNQGRWEKPCVKGPDAVVPGFLVNMGPTGARGQMTEDTFIVKYVFKKSPADGLLQIDDEVYGANGKQFSDHTFGRGFGVGIEGPIQDMGLAIEDSEGSDGVLKLMVRRGDDKLVVDIQLEKLGRFSDTFPVDCKKTGLLRDRAYQYLIDNHDGISSQGRCVATLALLSADDKRVQNEGKKMAKAWMSEYDESTWSWHLGFQSIALGEYYLLTKDHAALRVMRKNMELLRNAQWKAPIVHWTTEHIKNSDQETINKHQALYEGGFGHAPHPVIVERGGGGYGPMQWPTCLALMGWQLGKACGIEVDPAGPEASYTFLDHGTTDGGSVAYGGEFTLNGGPVNWENWKSNTGHRNSHKGGLAYLVYLLSPERAESKKKKKLFLTNIDVSYQDMPDGHADAIMGFTWGMAGTFASDDAKLKKKVSNYYKAWWNMARCHGSDSYIVLPARDYADHAYYNGNCRNHMTAAMAFIYSFGSPKLRIQGVGSNVAAAAAKPKEEELRTFHNADRSKSFEARLVAFDPRFGMVQVRTKGGRTINFEMEALCEEDKAYVKDFYKRMK